MNFPRRRRIATEWTKPCPACATRTPLRDPRRPKVVSQLRHATVMPPKVHDPVKTSVAEGSAGARRFTSTPPSVADGLHFHSPVVRDANLRAAEEHFDLQHSRLALPSRHREGPRQRTRTITEILPPRKFLLVTRRSTLPKAHEASRSSAVESEERPTLPPAANPAEEHPETDRNERNRPEVADVLCRAGRGCQRGRPHPQG